MPFTKTHIGFKVSISLLLAFLCAFISCVEVTDDGAGATGALVPAVVSFDVTVDELVESKALPLPEIEAPTEDEIHYVVKDKNGNVIYSDTGLWTENLLIPVGKYTVEATFNDNGFGEPAFAGSATGTVEPYEQERVTLTLQVVNALVSVSVDSDLNDHFTPGSEVTFTSGDKSHVSTLGEYCFVPSGKPLNLKLTGTNSVGKPSVFEYNLQSPSPRSAYEVICGKATTNWPAVSLSIDPAAAWGTRIYITSPATCSGSISESNKVIVYEAIPSSSTDWSQARSAVLDNGIPVIKKLTEGVEYQVRARVGSLVSPVVKVTPKFSGLTVSAAHSKNSDDELDGTDVTPKFDHSLSAVKSSIKSWNIDLCNSSGTVLRSGLQPEVTSDGSTFTSTTDWPYLPADSGESYRIRASVTMTDGEVLSFPTDIDCVVPPTPDFDVSMKSYTSYDKYAIQKNVPEANSCDPSTIYNVGASWKISLNLMKNTNYLKTLVVTDNGSELRRYEVTSFDVNEFYETISGCEWRAHELTASVTIVGKICSATQTHHVTGLPYRPTSMVEADWDKVSRNCEYSGGTIKLGGVSGSGEASVTSRMKFHIPASIGIKLNTNVTVRALDVGLFCVETDFTVKVNNITIIKQNSASQDNDNKGKNYNLSEISTFTTSGSSVKLNSSYTAAGPWSRVHSLEILYN